MLALKLVDSLLSTIGSKDAVSSMNKSTQNIPNKRIKNVIVCWDFDWSLVNQNSDYYVHEKLFGAEEYTCKIFPSLRQKAKSEGTEVFTDYMDIYGWPQIFQKFNLNSQSFADLVSDLPLFEENIQILRAIYEQSKSNNDGKTKMNINQYIISNANQVLIDIILKKNNLNGTVFKSDQIFTNYGWFDEESGILRCQRYHNIAGQNGKLSNMHCCNLCAANLCKGKVLNEEVLSRHNKPFKYENMIIYVGDGGNDFCPASELKEGDYVFVRQFEKCKGLEAKIKSDGDKLKCNVMKWKNGKELLQNFKKVLPNVFRQK